MFMFVKMSSGWIGREIQSISSALNTENVMQFIRSGEVVAFAEDLETFCYEMGLDESEIQVVQPA